jgi:hypothetical protein
MLTSDEARRLCDIMRCDAMCDALQAPILDAIRDDLDIMVRSSLDMLNILAALPPACLWARA